MAVTRENILLSQPARDRFLAGVAALAAEDSGITTAEVNQFLSTSVPDYRLFGKDQGLSTWDLFVLWHHLTMSLTTTPVRPMRNRAHGGPVFLPWHRLLMIRLEQQLQRVTNDPATALPYWDWAADGSLEPTAQPTSELWGQRCLGESSGSVLSGPLAGLRVHIEGYGTQLWSVDERPLRRSAGTDIDTLPTPADVAWALGVETDTDYDGFSWDSLSNGFRNRVEGWLDPNPINSWSPPQLHNRVHVWVGGDMSPGSSPNDPVFYLNHCNVDRIWEAWMARNGRSYLPTISDQAAPLGHRVNDMMVALLGESLRPSDVLDASQWYVYDDLTVA